MAQHDYVIDNQLFPAFRTDLNNALSAIVSNNSGGSDPSTTFANMFYYDTGDNKLKIRNEDNDAFIDLLELDQTNDTVEYFISDKIRTTEIGFTDGDAAITIADGGAITTSGNLTIGGNNNELRFTEGANHVGFEAPALSSDTIFKLPSADGSAGQVLKTDGSKNLSFGSASGKIIQIVPDSDTTTFSFSVTGASDTDVAGSKAYTITPTATSSRIKIDFLITQIRIRSAVSGLRMRVYRKIGSGSYAHVTGLSGTSAGNRRGAVAGNYDQQGDANRSSLWLGGTLVDHPNTTSAVEYKFYFGCGDSGTHTIDINRTQNDSDVTFTQRTRTHCCLSEVDIS
tara:strand:- start:824 stop:1846 length:1023 start_codon:yes stop_codon:yes gene_type:complete